MAPISGEEEKAFYIRYEEGFVIIDRVNWLCDLSGIFKRVLMDGSDCSWLFSVVLRCFACWV